MLDSLHISVQAGKGGDGLISFKREKFRPFGGPDGGDGGKGGDVILKVDPTLRTLSHLKNNKLYKAGDGEKGKSNFRHGKSGSNLIIPVPLGTLVYKLDPFSNKKILIADLNKPNQEFIVARGGRGGFGNAHFKSSTKQTPNYATKGQLGEKYDLFLEVKLLADVGLVGFPSVGKSSLVNALTKRSFKTAPYPFTTLSPNISVLHFKSKGDLVIADLPGLIEGASKGRGLGDTFLKHIERCGLIIHVLDVSNLPSYINNKSKEDVARELIGSYLLIRRELKNWSSDLLKKPEVIALNKVDIPKVSKLAPFLVRYLHDNISKNTSLSGNFFGELKIFTVSAFIPESLNLLYSFLHKNYNKITKISKNISFSSNKQKTYKDIGLHNVPNKRIVFRS